MTVFPETSILTQFLVLSPLLGPNRPAQGDLVFPGAFSARRPVSPLLSDGTTETSTSSPTLGSLRPSETFDPFRSLPKRGLGKVLLRRDGCGVKIGTLWTQSKTGRLDTLLLRHTKVR